ncbi:MAG: phosphoribosylglycinamide formyltransferase-1 [Oleiphilaceae bacterium]|jgi:phosphoribosylglycinamide formyltransferase-1
MDGRTPKIVVLISGNGSNLQAIINAVNSESFEAEIVAVISNKPNILGLEIATKANIPTAVIDHKQYPEREVFDAKLLREIEKHQPDLLVLAGFMRILTTDFVKRYEGRMINIHPSLLPKYPGLHTHKRAIEAGDSYHGITVHFVTAELDSGPNIIQAKVKTFENDTIESLAKRVQEQEHIIYPIAVKWFIEGRLEMSENHVLLDNEILPDTGLVLEAAKVLH